jgi:hypothetical protein
VALDSAELAALPAEDFRLVVALGPTDPGRLARLVERGGIVASEAPSEEIADLPGRLAMLGLRVLEVTPASEDGARVISRREDA